MYIYLITCMSTYLLVCLFNQEMEDLFGGSWIFSTCRRWDQETTTGLLANYIATGQTHVYVSVLTCTGIPVAVCMRCVHTHVMTVYLIQGTLEVPQC